MAAPLPDRTGVLVIRVWLESPTTSCGLRARLIRTSDVMTGELETTVAATVNDVCDQVRTWPFANEKDPRSRRRSGWPGRETSALAP